MEYYNPRGRCTYCLHPAEDHTLNTGFTSACGIKDCVCLDLNWDHKPWGENIFECPSVDDIIDMTPVRDELLKFAYWLLEDEIGAGHEEEIVDKYLKEHPLP